MGLLRLLFALSVLIFHAGLLFNYNIVNDQRAIFSFFIISGFYMALILDKKYTKEKSVFLFWSNRFLRIFPLYWFTLLVMFAFVLVKFFFTIGDDNVITHYIKRSAQMTPFEFTIDLINYIIRNITLIINLDYFRVNNSTPGYLLVQQAWTLQYELLFYVIAPCIARLSKKVFIMFFVTYIAAFWGVVVPLHLLQENLLYLFLSNLIFFLLGMISYTFIYKLIPKKKLTSNVARSVYIAFILYLIFYNALPFKEIFSFNTSLDFLYFAILICSIPIIFSYTSNNKVDRFIGELSYPVYIIHFIVIKALTNIPTLSNNSNFKTILVIVITLILSYFIVKYIDAPIDRIRQARLKR